MSDEARQQYRQRLDNHIVEERMAKIDGLRAAGTNPFANGFVVSHTAADIVAEWAGQTAEQLEAVDTVVTVAGRLRFHRKMGKAAFLKIQDRTCIPGLKDADGAEAQDNFLQAFVSKVNIGDENFDAVKALDLGDIVGIEGKPMRTRTGELSIKAQRVVLLTKSLRPLPEKFKGLSDVETRYRQRYVDLVMNEEAQQIFRSRTRIVRQIRDFLDARGYMEVETPMMHVTPGGASARPFKTHHNALDIPLFLRIAPELYLKRLIVGGFERVYELNRNFRNEGVSRKHNPEFTMLEFYQAYATYEDLMDLTEEMVAHLAESMHGRDESGRITFECEGHTIDVTAPWARIPMGKSVSDALGVSEDKMWDRPYLAAEAKKRGVEVAASWDEGKIVTELFEILVEPSLIQPTFITDFPASTSPLSRRKDDDPRLVDRFELFVLGRELANAFSELNDPEDQYMRFAEQLQARADGDDEAMPMDEDYVRALEYGMPPTAGEGIGIDRLVMLLTGTDSIREVILFPHMRPE